MHCLGAVTDLSSGKVNISPGGNRGNVLSVVQSLGVLVCEGRIQGSPRGYKEGPHCSVPLQTIPNNHVCDKDNYLCNRYLVLTKEIADRVEIGANLCIEVFMCGDCPYGHATATCNNPISSIPPTLISQWPHSSEILLEYWRIGVLPSKSSEMMNPLALYQAVRSRLHFSQVAAWWSRSNGTKPAYVATRIIPHNADNLRNFRETPIEHTFPLAAIGDGNSVNVTVWALPRMKDVPTFACPIHRGKDLQEEECAARAVTPTKNIVSSRLDINLVLPSLVDDRLQTPCDKSGKHHCSCEDEDGCPPSPCIKPNGERKRRRSLPCGPPDAGSCSTFNNVSLMSVIETNSSNASRDAGTSYTDTKLSSDVERFNNRSYASTSTQERSFRTQVKLTLEASECNDEKRYKPSSELLAAEMKSYVNNTPPIGSNKFKSFVPFVESQDLRMSEMLNGDATKPDNSQEINNLPSVPTKTNIVVNPFAEHFSSYETNCGPSTFFSSTLCNNNNNSNNNNNRTSSSSSSSSNNNNNSSSCCSSSSSNSSSSTSSSSNNSSSSINNNIINLNTDKSPNKKILDNLEEKLIKSPINSGHGNKDLSHLMSKLTFPKETNNKVRKEENGILDWISKVPGRVLGGASNSNHILEDGNKSTTNGFKDENQEQKQLRNSNAIKFKNCNLELSQREFDEVLAVLRARTPTNRRCTQVKTLRRRERVDKIVDCNILEKTPIKNVSSASHTNYAHCENSQSTESIRNSIFQSYKNLSPTDSCQKSCNKADVLLEAILRTSRDRKGLIDISNDTIPRTVLPNDTSDDIHCNIQSALTGEDTDSLAPSMLNKKLNRLKLFFKKEQERRETLTKDLLDPKNNLLNSPSDYDRQKINLKNTNKAKRKIDFTNYSTNINQIESSCEEFVNGTTSNTQEDSACHRIENGFKVEDFNDHDALTKNISVSSANHSNKDHYEDDDHISENDQFNKKSHDKSRNSIEDEINDKNVPSTIEQERFRRSLENAASMVFHCRTGLPLTSSPAPLRRGSCCFDYDSTLNSASSKRSALFELNTPPSPGAASLEEKQFPESDETPKRSFARSRPQSYSLLGNFEESALNGRLEPVSTVHGFTAEIGASGIFCPKHRKLPVTVFFYTLGDNDKVSTPYLAHINLGKKGYQVPRSGTIQVTLLNPLGTVVKMFVVLYDLSDMPPRSHTFLRQRTMRDKTLRYLIHLRFMSGKSGRIYLHTDIRIIICHKSDVDTASDFASEPPKELKSYIHGPTNPKFSPRC